MARQQAFQNRSMQPEDRLRVLDVADRPRECGPWLTIRQVQAYVPCASLKATYEWLRRRRIVRASDGTVARADLERVKRQPRTARVMAATSLANLRKRRSA